jgi:hypothetical protein
VVSIVDRKYRERREEPGVWRGSAGTNVVSFSSDRLLNNYFDAADTLWNPSTIG